MPKHLSTQQVSELVARQVAPDDLSATMHHLVECGACRSKVSAIYNTEKMFDALHLHFQTNAVATEHLTYEQLSRFVDQSLTIEERVEAQIHLKSCDDCAVEVRELGILWADIQTASSLPSNRIPQKRERWFQKPVFFRYGLAVPTIAIILVIVAVNWRPTTKLQPDEIAGKGLTASSSPDRAITIPTPLVKNTVEPVTNLALMDHGQRVALDLQGNLIGLTDLPANYQQIVKAAFSNQRAPVSSTINELEFSKGTLLGSEDREAAFDLISPVGKVLSVDRPAFHWQKVAGAEIYSVVVLDQKLNVVASGETDGVNNWTSPKALPRNQVLRWQVTAQIGEKRIISPAPPLPEARFKILPLAKAIELTRAAKEYANSHLLLGSLYSEVGLMDKAEREFRSLLAENPESKLAQKLLRSVQIRRNSL